MTTQNVAADSFRVAGRIAVNASNGGEQQKGYNLLVLNLEAVEALDSLRAEFEELDPTDSQGQYWVGVTIDPAGKAKIRQAGKTGATKMVVEGVVTVVDIVNGKPQGFLRVTSARPATLRDGGRLIQRQARSQDPASANAPASTQTLRK